MTWNGNAVTGRDSVLKFLENLPECEHSVEGFDAHPVASMYCIHELEWREFYGTKAFSFSLSIFPGETVLAGFIEAKDDENGGDNWSYKSCKVPVKSVTTNKPTPNFLQAGCRSCHPTNRVKSIEGIW